LTDKDGIVDIPFRRAESKYSFEQAGVNVSFTAVRWMVRL